MAKPSLFSRAFSLLRSPGPLPRATPFREMGVSGTAIFSGLVQQRERDARLVGSQKWITFSDLMTNTSIVASGTRYMLNLITYADWSVDPADESGEAKQVADLVDSIINDTSTPWARIARRASMYRFHGFGIQEWTAKKRDSDGKIGLDDVEARPNHTIERWEVDDNGSVIGVWQRAPMGGDLLFLPRSKILYMVDDSLTDSPEGIGLYRHLIEPWERLKKYYELEGRGYERDLRGIPIGRVPYTKIRDAVKSGQMAKDDANQITRAIEDFVKMQSKSNDTSIVMDSIPYITETDSGQSLSGTMQYGLELLQGGSMGFAEMGKAIERTIEEMARILGVENLLLGSGNSGGNRALAADKSQNFYLVVNGTLDEIADAANKDVIKPICDLNGVKDEMRPKLKHSEVSFRTVAEITAALAQLATAGAVLRPDDPAINDIRDLLGLEPQAEPDMQMFNQQQQAKAGMKLGPDGKPVDPVQMAEATTRAKFGGQPPGSKLNGKTPPGSPPSAKEGGTGSLGNQDVTKPRFLKKSEDTMEFFDLDDIDKANPNQARNPAGAAGGTGGRFARGSSSSFRSSRSYTDVPIKDNLEPPIVKVPGMGAKILRTIDWLNSPDVRAIGGDIADQAIRGAITHVLSAIVSMTAHHHGAGHELDREGHNRLHGDIRNLISEVVHHVGRSVPEGENKPGLDFVTLGHGRTLVYLAIHAYKKYRESQLKKVETDPIIEILDALKATLDSLGSDEALAKVGNPYHDKEGKFSSPDNAFDLHNMQQVREFEARAQSRFSNLLGKLGPHIGDRVDDIKRFFLYQPDPKAKENTSPLKESAHVLVREAAAQLMTEVLKQTANEHDLHFDPRVKRFIERAAHGEAQQKDITVGQGRATFRLGVNWFKAKRRAQLNKDTKKAERPNPEENWDPILVVLDYLSNTLDDLDQEEQELNDHQALVEQNSMAKVVDGHVMKVGDTFIVLEDKDGLGDVAS